MAVAARSLDATPDKIALACFGALGIVAMTVLSHRQAMI
jgi:hypothetical protein